MAVLLNLLPVPPLDGYRAIAPFLGRRLRIALNQWGAITLWILLAVLWFVPAANAWFWLATNRFAAVLGIPLTLALRGLRDFRIFG
jgi:Zn-dependent protease